MNAWLAAAAGFALSCIVAGVHARFARGRLLDVPGARSSHRAPTPSAGGIAVLAGLALGVLALSPAPGADWWLALELAALLGLVGLADDLRALRAWPRLLAQVLAAGVLIGALMPAVAGAAGLIGAGFAVIALAWLVNAFNFMDGLDGLAGSHALFMALAAALLAHDAGAAADTPAVLLCTAAATGGFLLWNLPPARLFMGDTGSLALGFLLGAAALLTVQRGELQVAVWLILWAPILCDTGLTLVQRAVRGEALYAAHRGHAYQRLARRWDSHARVTTGLAAFDWLCLLPLALLAQRLPQYAPLIAAAAWVPALVLVLRVLRGCPDDPRNNATGS